LPQVRSAEETALLKSEILDFKTACKNAAADKNSMNILSYESENNSKFLINNIFIGPEGGFENEKLEFAKSLGIRTITLGDNILRVKTAAVVASILILNFLKILNEKILYTHFRVQSKSIRIAAHFRKI
jgi:16S rRNA (uracil1498-N3)-methyltransferase